MSKPKTEAPKTTSSERRRWRARGCKCDARSPMTLRRFCDGCRGAVSFRHYFAYRVGRGIVAADFAVAWRSHLALFRRERAQAKETARRWKANARKRKRDAREAKSTTAAAAKVWRAAFGDDPPRGFRVAFTDESLGARTVGRAWLPNLVKLNRERSEGIGDALLSLVIHEFIHLRFPKLGHGREFNERVFRATCVLFGEMPPERFLHWQAAAEARRLGYYGGPNANDLAWREWNREIRAERKQRAEKRRERREAMRDRMAELRDHAERVNATTTPQPHDEDGLGSLRSLLRLDQ